MPDIGIKGLGGGKYATWLSVAGDFKPGDMPPIGYCDWHEWAEVQEKAGLHQKRCSVCSKLGYPQEIASVSIQSTVAYKTKRDLERCTNPIEVKSETVICKKCEAIRTA